MYYVNGHYVNKDEARISVLDLGLLRGFGAFEYLRTYGGRPFHLEEHWLRLQYSVDQLGLELPLNFKELTQILLNLKEMNHLEEASFKIVITGGISDNQFLPHQAPSLIVLAYPFKPYPANYYSQGIHALTTPLARSLPTSKTTQYTPAIVTLQKSGAQEALYLNARGEVLEGATSNFFAFHGDVLYTCDSEEILFGITREVMLHLASPHFSIVRRALCVPQIEEAFITASNKEIMPVSRIDEKFVSVGARTQKLMQLFEAYTQQEVHPPLHIARYSKQAQF